MQKKITKLKTLLSPLRFIKKDLSITMIGEFFEGFHTIFSVQILAFIISSIQSKDTDRFYFWIIVFIVLEILAYLFMFLRTRFFSKSFYSMGHILNTIYLKKFINLDNNKIDMLGTGRSFSIISKGVDSWIEIVLARGINILIGVVAITYAFVIIAYTAGISYLLVVFSIFLMIFGIVVYGNNLSLKYRRGRKEVTTEYDRNLFKMISSKFEILQNNRISKENFRLGGMLDKILRLSAKEEFITSSWNVAVMIVFAFIQLTVFFWLGLGVIDGTVNFAYFILIFGLVNEINRYVWGFSKEIRTIGVQMVNVDMLLETFDGIAEIRGINNTTPFNHSRGDISIRNIGFGYTEEKIFDGLSLDIRGNHKTALVGDSGGGKTTLMKLIAGYINPDCGNIIIDGQDIGDVDLITYYKNIGYLTQDPSVFDGTIMENLIYALDREPTQEEITDTIRNSKCEFILEMPDGLETEIGERGIKLSGGQKQRLAIAKIMLKDPNIILLDEPTSALDSISEQVVSEALHNLFRGRTVIVIAHRLQTVKEADDIIVIKKGKVIERGTHEELSQIKDGEYKRMLDLQTSF